MVNPLIRKLETVGPLSRDDKTTLDRLCGDVRKFDAHQAIIRQGDRPNFVHLVLEGWAARFKIIPSGERQITGFLLPGDFCDLHITILKEMDHGIFAVAPTTVARIPAKAMEELPIQRPTLARVL
jgi:CRP-like cAMP-binding protein